MNFIYIYLSTQICYTFIKIKKGDTIWIIARNHKLSLDSIISLNQIKSVHKLSAGKTIKIPRLNGLFYQTKKYDSIEKIARTYKVPLDEIKRFNKTSSYLCKK